jgi:hypothetical protein
MNVWQSLTKPLLLEDGRDVLARIGQRFVWCTGPYFLAALILSIFGDNKLLSPWLSLWILAIPFLGGVIDWRRLTSRSKRASSTTA